MPKALEVTPRKTSISGQLDPGLVVEKGDNIVRAALDAELEPRLGHHEFSLRRLPRPEAPCRLKALTPRAGTAPSQQHKPHPKRKLDRLSSLSHLPPQSTGCCLECLVPVALFTRPFWSTCNTKQPPLVCQGKTVIQSRLDPASWLLKQFIFSSRRPHALLILLRLPKETGP